MRPQYLILILALSLCGCGAQEAIWPYSLHEALPVVSVVDEPGSMQNYQRTIEVALGISLPPDNSPILVRATGRYQTSENVAISIFAERYSAQKNSFFFGSLVHEYSLTTIGPGIEYQWRSDEASYWYLRGGMDAVFATVESSQETLLSDNPVFWLDIETGYRVQKDRNVLGAAAYIRAGGDVKMGSSSGGFSQSFSVSGDYGLTAFVGHLF